MKALSIYNPLVIFAALGSIVVLTVALSYFSYHYTVGRENVAETSLVQSNQKLAKHYVDRIEQEIVENDLVLSQMVDVNDPAKWPSMVETIKESDLNVDQVYFFRPDSNYPRYPPGASHPSFDIKELDIDRMVLDQPHHLHKERRNNYFFATFVLKENRKGSRILICYQMNFNKIIALLDKNLHDLQDRYYVSIVDYENNGVYLQPISRSSKFFLETRFPNALYKWILQMVPRNYAELEQGVRNQRRLNLIFIIVSMSFIFISLAIIYVAWQRDRQLRQLKEDFISNVSHELKTPLSLISMFSEILAMGRVNDEDKRLDYYRIIHNESDRMSRLIMNLLDFANLGRGIDPRHFEKTNIAQLAAKALEAYRYAIQKDGFQVNLETQSDIPDSFADPNAITMAFFNLLDNSVKYSGNQRQIDVKVGRGNGFVDLTVIDKGIGIPASEQQKIFEKFYRGSEPAIRRIRGSGIGLAITKHVAEMHGGKVWVESEPGKGSTFTLRIPILNAIKDLKFKASDLK
jgi:two-component system, OmpR family, phosphate regulon sensor histidine kinase PhoR